MSVMSSTSRVGFGNALRFWIVIRSSDVVADARALCATIDADLEAPHIGPVQMNARMAVRTRM